MTFGQFNKINVKEATLAPDGKVVTRNQDVVQIMWDEVRNTYSTNMDLIHFESMDHEQCFLKADALKDFVSY